MSTSKKEAKSANMFMRLHYTITLFLVLKVHIVAANKTDEWVVIGISGVTAGGKTTLANKLQEVLTPVYVFHQDDYYYPDDSPNHVKCDSYDLINYDVLTAFDMGKMFDDILRTRNGANIQETDLRRGRMGFREKRFLLIEGITVLNFPPILDMCDLRYYFVLPYEESFSRRSARGYQHDVQGYFEKCVWPEHLRYKAEIVKDKSVKILNGMQVTKLMALDIVLEDLKTLKK